MNAKNKRCGKFTAHSAHLGIIVEKELPISPQITKNNTSNLQYFGNKNNGNLLPKNMLLNRQPSSEKIFKIDSPRPHPVPREGPISGRVVLVPSTDAWPRFKIRSSVRGNISAVLFKCLGIKSCQSLVSLELLR